MSIPSERITRGILGMVGLCASGIIVSGCGSLADSLPKPDKSASSSTAAPTDAAATVEAPVAAPGSPAATAAPGSDVPQASSSHVGKKTRVILNAKELESNPDWTVITLKTEGADPLSVAGSTYNRAAAFTGSLGIVQWLKTEQALNGKWPSYIELQQFMKANPALELPATKVYQAYGYDERTGQMVILENKDQKEIRYEELGIKE